MGMIGRLLGIGLLGGAALGTGVASDKGYGVKRLERPDPSVRNNSVMGPFFGGRGYRGGK